MDESQLELEDEFPVKKSSLARTIGLGMLFGWIYVSWWFLRRRKALARLPGGNAVPLWMLILFLVSGAVSATAGFGASTFLDMANMQDSVEYFHIAERLHLGGKGVGMLSLGLYLLLCFQIKGVLDLYLRRTNKFAQSLSGWMTVFFGVFYLQHTMNKMHSTVQERTPRRFCFSNQWLAVLYSSAAVFLVTVFSAVVLYWVTSLFPVNGGDGFTYMIVLCVFAVNAIADRYTGDWNGFAKKVPLFVIVAFVGGVWCGAMLGNEFRVDERLLASAPHELKVKTGSDACDLVGWSHYQLGDSTSYMPRLRKRKGRLEWVVRVTNESHSERWVIDAETGEILRPNPLPKAYRTRGDILNRE